MSVMDISAQRWLYVFEKLIVLPLILQNNENKNISLSLKLHKIKVDLVCKNTQNIAPIWSLKIRNGDLVKIWHKKIANNH